MPEENKKIKLENINFRGQVSYKNLEIILSNLKQIAEFPPLEPTEKVKKRHPHVSATEREVLVKDDYNKIFYFVQDKGLTQKSLLTYLTYVNCTGYFIDVKNKGELTAVRKNINLFYEHMGITFL